MAIFSATEIARRHKAVRDRMTDTDAVVAFSFFNAYYLTGVPILGWGRPTIAILPKDGDPTIVAAGGELARIRKYAPIDDVRTYSDLDGPNVNASLRLTADVITSLGARRIGVDANGTPAATLDMLRDLLDGVDIVDVSEILDDEKAVFSNEELGHVRAVADILDHGMTRYLDTARLGMAEIVLAGRAMVAMMEFAATQYPAAEVRVNCYSQQGLRTLEPHTASTGAPLEAGQLMCVVMEAYVWNYQGALERTIALGDIPADAQRLNTTIVEAQQRAFEAIGPGTPMSEVDRVSRAVFEAAGFAVAPSGAGLGRGLLTEWDGRLDRMNLRAYNDRTMVPNMVFTVEPFTFAENIGAPRHCDLVRVADDGREILNKARSGYLVIR